MRRWASVVARRRLRKNWQRLKLELCELLNDPNRRVQVNILMNAWEGNSCIMWSGADSDDVFRMANQERFDPIPVDIRKALEEVKRGDIGSRSSAATL